MEAENPPRNAVDGNMRVPNLQKRSGKNMFHEHFHVVYPLPKVAGDSLGSFAAMSARPVDLYCKEEVDCVARGFRFREACFLARERFARLTRGAKRMGGRLLDALRERWAH